MALPSRSDFDSIDEWVMQVAEQTKVSQDIVWEIVEEFKPGAKAVSEEEKYSLLRRLLEHHEQYMTANLEAHGQPDDSCKIQVFLDGEVAYEFMYSTHNVIKLNESQKEILREIIVDENMQIQSEGDRFLAAFLPDGGIDEELRVMSRILRDVYDSSVADIDRAIEVRGTDEFAWTDTDELQENIESVTRMELQSNQAEPSGEGSQRKRTNSSQSRKEYDSWIFCQKCGDRIEHPDANPRFCTDCRE